MSMFLECIRLGRSIVENWSSQMSHSTANPMEGQLSLFCARARCWGRRPCCVLSGIPPIWPLPKKGRQMGAHSEDVRGWFSVPKNHLCRAWTKLSLEKRWPSNTAQVSAPCHSVPYSVSVHCYSSHTQCKEKVNQCSAHLHLIFSITVSQ